MYERELNIECERGKYKPGDIIVLNDEKWIVTTIHHSVTDRVICHPLLDFVINTNVIQLEGETHPFKLADYINHLIDMFTIKKECEKNESD